MRFSEKNRIFWFFAIILAFLAMAYLIVPPLLPLGRFRNHFANALTNTVGEPVVIDGKIKLSLLGYPMIAAENIRINDSVMIRSVRFRISWGSVFNLSNAKIVSAVKVSGLKMDVAKLAVPNFGAKIIISDSMVNFSGKDYEILDGSLDHGKLSARVRASQHKYNLEIVGSEFRITNPNEDLTIRGKLQSDENGALVATGTLSMEVKDANKWFGFVYPKVRGATKLAMNFVWNGKGGFDFSKISGETEDTSFSGRIKLQYENGVLMYKSIRMRIKNADMDLSFLKDSPSFLYNSDFNIVMTGRIKTPVSKIGNVSELSFVSESQSDKAINIKALKFANDKMSATVSGNLAGANSGQLDVALYQAKPAQSVRCRLAIDGKDWSCNPWSIAHKEMSGIGTLFVSESDFYMTVSSENMSMDALGRLWKYMGDRSGKIEFKIGDVDGAAIITGNKTKIDYTKKSAVLAELAPDLPLSKTMLAVSGNAAVTIDDDRTSFVFQAPGWSLSVKENSEFSIIHKDARRMLTELTGKKELPFVRADIPAMATGKYRKSIISDLRVQLGDMTFSGSASDRALRLSTNRLDLDQILDKNWFETFEDNQYVSGDPLLALFDFGGELTLAADVIKLNDVNYSGFIYSLNSSNQNMSISDSENGNMLLSISKAGNKYKYLVQLSKFFAPGKLFSQNAPINFEGATITAQAELSTYGLTAYDVRRNMEGIVEASIDGGFVHGLGTDEFYDNVFNYGKMDTENALHRMLSRGTTRVKEFEIEGTYSGGDFRTTKPFLLTARHTDMTGNLSIRGDASHVRANIILRGTSPVPRPVLLTIDGDKRDYSLSDMLRDIDLDYLREFVRTHKKF